MVKCGSIPHTPQFLIVKIFRKMKKIEFYIGTGFNAQNEVMPQNEVLACLQVIKRICASKFGGYSINEVQGGYINSEGLLVEETSVNITVFSAKIETADICGRTFAQIMSQESVLTIVSDCVIHFVGQ